MSQSPGWGITVRIVVPFALGYFLSYFYRVINALIAPELTSELTLDATALGFLTSAYFFTFAAFQIPLGVFLDRFGPRRTESALLIVAATGAVVFATSDSVAALVLGRALIGLGVSACLMAAFKAYVLWFPAERRPLVNGLHMGIGGFGALVAPRPVDIALLPINGNLPERRVAGNLDGREAVVLGKDIGAQVVIPCHYDCPGLFTRRLNPADDQLFKKEAERAGAKCIILKDGESVNL